MANLTLRPLYPMRTQVPTEQEAGWTPEPNWMVLKKKESKEKEKTIALPEFKPRVTHLIASCYIGYAVPAPHMRCMHPK